MTTLSAQRTHWAARVRLALTAPAASAGRSLGDQTTHTVGTRTRIGGEQGRGGRLVDGLLMHAAPAPSSAMRRLHRLHRRGHEHGARRQRRETSKQTPRSPTLNTTDFATTPLSIFISNILLSLSPYYIVLLIPITNYRYSLIVTRTNRVETEHGKPGIGYEVGGGGVLKNAAYTHSDRERWLRKRPVAASTTRR